MSDVNKDSEVRKRTFGNGDLTHGASTSRGTPSPNGTPEDAPRPSRIQKEINFQIFKDKTTKFRCDLVENFDNQLQELVEDFMQNIQGLSKDDEAITAAVLAEKQKRKQGELTDKVFIPRMSVLTELLEINHIRTIYHMFVAILIVFSLNTIVYDLVDQGRLILNFEIIIYAFGKFPIVMWVWVIMKLSSIGIVYPIFSWWANNRRPGKPYWLDWIGLSLFFTYQMLFLILPVQAITECGIPPASTVCITCEQVRLLMKNHAFVRENIPRALRYNKDKAKEEDNDIESACPGFSKYLYFLFAPTLVYRDHYPRTPTIRWNYVVSNFGQVFACLFYTYYIFERFCVPVFKNFNGDHLTPKKLILSSFGSMLPGTLVLLIGFFAILHSWLNAFAEMLRFADRLFYKDWWNSSSFAMYYRTWNVVVHDWLYAYIYKDCHYLYGKAWKTTSMLTVFLLSAVVHEYILTVTLGFFYPVLFLMFQGAGFGFVFLPSKATRSGNVFMWVSLFIGNGVLMCLYCMEWYARQLCPQSQDEGFLDVLMPKSFTCDFAKLAQQTANGTV